MHIRSTLILRAAILAIGMIVAILCGLISYALMFANLDYFAPVLGILLISGVPFFAAVYQSLNLLSHIDKNRAFSDHSVKALTNIKYSGIAIVAIYSLGMPFIFYAADTDDAPGVILIALTIIFGAFTVATFAALMQKLLQNAIAIKSENDLTV